MKLRPLHTALAAVALSPASAIAAPQWSAPADVIPATGSAVVSNSAPQAFVAGGRSLVTAGVGEYALLVRGSATNVFDSPITVASAPGNTVGTNTAVAGDGTVAIAWAAGGAGHVSIVTPSGSVLPQADLPGAGVNAIGVGIASDGSAIVAYRTKESGSSYALRVAIAAAGSSTFGEPVTLDASAPTDSIDVATGPDGAAAIAYRKLVGKYRARVAVRPAGASAFEAGQAFSAAGDQDDYSPQVAFDGDGTIVAAWGNAAGAQYALRAPGASAFGAATPLGGGSAYTVDLESTPAGGSAVAIAGSGVVRAALQGAPGASFSEPVAVGPAYTSPISGSAAVTTTPAGTVTVVFSNPADGTVHAVDAGGGDQVIGYGSKDALTPVAVASGADRTVAAWTSVAGATTVATRSESAKPGPLGPKPGGRDTTAPKVRYVSGSKRFRVTAKTRTISFKVRCSEACKYVVTGSLRTQLSSRSRRQIAPLPLVASRKARTGIQKVTVKLGGLAQKDLRKALSRRRGGQLFLVLEASDAAANTSRTRVQLTLRPAAKKGHR
ncbi:MAG TPA: hypothetical protein VNT03_04300 [Baekduia sp.]|nr:hypothetical protein [Baekduia sp.]